MGHDERGGEVRAQQLAAQKIPERLEIIDALPRNAMGKIVRADLPALLP